MARIRVIKIRHFRGIESLAWLPSAGVNCLIGPGDSSKSTILDAIDICLGARRSLSITDADFFRLDTTIPISIAITLGDLDDQLKNFDAYGSYLQGFDASSGAIEEEPGQGLEPVLTVKLEVAADLEPYWFLESSRGEAGEAARGLRWSARLRISPTRIGAMADYHLGWGRGSVLNRLSDERADAAASLAEAVRGARKGFGDSAQDTLAESLRIVTATATELGVPIGGSARALLDMDALSLNSRAVSLHDADGVPLKRLGVGSARLLVAGIQRKTAAESNILLLDELEYGLEPHRVIRLLGSVGAKEKNPPLQVFATSHSPVAIRELSGAQVFVVRRTGNEHSATAVGVDNDAQGAARLYPDALLSAAIVVCEGASEVGLLRGLDLYLSSHGCPSLMARGVALVDCAGGEANRPYTRALTFLRLGYRVAVLRDSDQPATPEMEPETLAAGGLVVSWRPPHALEQELFGSLSQAAVGLLLTRAVELVGEGPVDDHIKSASNGALSLQQARLEIALGGPGLPAVRATLGLAAKRSGWYKTVTRMENVARDIVGPDLGAANAEFRDLALAVFLWAQNV